MQRCTAQGDKCLGLPPFSCEAFAGSGLYILSLSNPLHCDKCDGKVLFTVMLICGAALLLLVAFCFFAALVMRHPEQLRRSVSTLTIIISQLQTTAILGALDLEWPPSIQSVMDVLAFDLLQLPSSSCLAPEASFNPFWMYPLGIFAGALSVNLTLIMLITLRRGRRAARAELVLSLFFSLQLTITWRSMADVAVVFSSGFRHWTQVAPSTLSALSWLASQPPSNPSMPSPLYPRPGMPSSPASACSLTPCSHKLSRPTSRHIRTHTPTSTVSLVLTLIFLDAGWHCTARRYTHALAGPPAGALIAIKERREDPEGSPFYGGGAIKPTRAYHPIKLDEPAMIKIA